VIGLLDVNVLIALIDERHMATEAAQRWFETNHHVGWATCPITENGVLRIVGDPRYPNYPGSFEQVALTLRALRTMPGHIFWPDSISFVGTQLIETAKLPAAKHVTDSYLLALAIEHGGQLVTLDRKLATIAVAGGAQALHLIAG